MQFFKKKQMFLKFQGHFKLFKLLQSFLQKLKYAQKVHQKNKKIQNVKEFQPLDTQCQPTYIKSIMLTNRSNACCRFYDD